MPLLEICVDSIESAIAALKGGAERLELCSALSEGGLTPTVGTLKTLKQLLNIQIPIFCMLRPRGGNDFIYMEEEIHTIIQDMKILQQNGCDGFVFGALNYEREINIKQCELIIKNAIDDHGKLLPVTFHRAFDLTKVEKLHENCELIKTLGFQRILTSGLRKNAEEGLQNLKDLIEKHGESIIIMPGAGISNKNLEKIIKESGCKEFHASGKKKKQTISVMPESNTNVTMGTGDKAQDEYTVFVTDADIVRELVEIAKLFK